MKLKNNIEKYYFIIHSQEEYVKYTKILKEKNIPIKFHYYSEKDWKYFAYRKDCDAVGLKVMNIHKDELIINVNTFEEWCKECIEEYKPETTTLEPNQVTEWDKSNKLLILPEYEEESKKVQEIAFSLGYYWYKDKKEVAFTKSAEIFLYTDKNMYHNTKDSGAKKYNKWMYAKDFINKYGMADIMNSPIITSQIPAPKFKVGDKVQVCEWGKCNGSGFRYNSNISYEAIKSAANLKQLITSSSYDNTKKEYYYNLDWDRNGSVAEHALTLVNTAPEMATTTFKVGDIVELAYRIGESINGEVRKPVEGERGAKGKIVTIDSYTGFIYIKELDCYFAPEHFKLVTESTATKNKVVYWIDSDKDRCINMTFGKAYEVLKTDRSCYWVINDKGKQDNWVHSSFSDTPPTTVVNKEEYFAVNDVVELVNARGLSYPDKIGTRKVVKEVLDRWVKFQGGDIWFKEDIRKICSTIPEETYPGIDGQSFTITLDASFFPKKEKTKLNLTLTKESTIDYYFEKKAKKKSIKLNLNPIN